MKIETIKRVVLEQSDTIVISGLDREHLVQGGGSYLSVPMSKLSDGAFESAADLLGRLSISQHAGFSLKGEAPQQDKGYIVSVKTTVGLPDFSGSDPLTEVFNGYGKATPHILMQLQALLQQSSIEHAQNHPKVFY